MNTPDSILKLTDRRLHLQKDHPVSITRKLIESRFPSFKTYNEFYPVVTTRENFDVLRFPLDHPGRSRTDTYYINKHTVLRTHTSAHELQVFSSKTTPGYLISADVYRRDAIDRTHYPAFHQMEGALMWDRAEHGGNVAEAAWKQVETIPKHDMVVEDSNPTVHPERNPLQSDHTIEEVEAIAASLKRSLEDVVATIFSEARDARIREAEAKGLATPPEREPLRVRWVEAYFPWTSPSWELEVFWAGDWLEILGCGVVVQDTLKEAGIPTQLGWAFGIGLERLAILLFGISDIRLFWSTDQRFLKQFSEESPIKRFKSFSKYPSCYKDVTFWLRGTSSAGGGSAASIQDFHENDIMEFVRDFAGDLVEDVKLADEFTHPKTGRKSLCYRIHYRSLERTLNNVEVTALHKELCKSMSQKLGVEIR